ncbi:MAG: hypothetical protein JSR66_19265 [Proteobacteria bacterium]|nr:hypothetical protein [Pseudomonadota bacterium]
MSRLLPRPALTPGFVERALQQYRVAKQFEHNLGYTGNFTNPRNYHEKVQFRKLYGNHEYYARVADKYAVREYVSERIGAQYLKPLLGVYTRLTPALLQSLPRPFIIKTNNGCRGHRIVRQQDRPDWQSLIAHFEALRRTAFGRGSGEIHYDRIPFRILVETLLQESDGGPLWEYDIWCFNSRAGFRHLPSLISPRDDKLSFDQDWNFLQGPQPDAAVLPRINPPQFSRMLQLARALSADFDFVRVDFNLIGDQIYFGEITCTPGQGYTAITSPRRMQLLNELWELDSLNPRLYRPPRGHSPRST